MIKMSPKEWATSILHIQSVTPDPAEALRRVSAESLQHHKGRRAQVNEEILQIKNMFVQLRLIPLVLFTLLCPGSAVGLDNRHHMTGLSIRGSEVTWSLRNTAG